MAKRIRILLFDSSNIMREALGALIATTPDMAVVGETADENKAIEQASLLRPDLIIADLETPAGESANLTVLLRRLDPNIRILMLTNALDRERVQAAIEAGVQGYLLKGTAAPAILQAIRDLDRGEPVFDPALVDAQE